MYIVGISAFYHDSAACLIKDGEIIAAAQEERFTRRKHDSAFPTHALKYCLKAADITPNLIDNVVFYEKPIVKFERLIETYLAFAPRGFRSFSKAIPAWIGEKLFQKSLLVKELNKSLGHDLDWRSLLLFSDHHLSHAASAFYPSPFDNAAILTLDGVGEWCTSSISVGKNELINVIKEQRFPNSLGLLYSAFTYYCGFKVNSGEYKLMGLAPYGEPRYVTEIKNNLIAINEDGSFKLNMDYFDFATGLTMTNLNFNSLFGGPARDSETLLTQRHMDLAASIQKVTEEIVLKTAKHIAFETGLDNLCLAGGVALNCVANGVLQKEKIFKNIWIQPASGDAGGAIGAALAAWYLHNGSARKRDDRSDCMKGSYLGPEYSDQEIERDLKSCGACYIKLTREEMISEVALQLSREKAVGWMQGRMEFGPRALGCRSIIADPRSPSMQKQLNLKVKYRESFRPFAPSILVEDLANWFEIDCSSPYMLMVAGIIENHRRKMTEEEELLFGIDKLNVSRSSIPAVTHVDYSARIQTVHPDTNNTYYSLLKKFKEITNCPILVNTSFNVRGEPIVCSPKDAFKCFMGTELDILVVGNFLMLKDQQNKELKENYKTKYALD